MGRMGGDGAVAVTDRKRPKGCASSRKAPDINPEARHSEQAPDGESPSVSDRLHAIVEDDSMPLTASRAIDLVARFMAVVPESSREDMDRLKLLDKFLNTARALMETRLKTEDARDLSERLDAIEKELGQ